ncbi:MAG: D-Ala-D-Ala carboxypeptidase family metallohydrolase [Blastocatellia bacterium]
MQLGKYFTLEEFTISQTAIRRGIDNTPTPEVFANLEALTLNLLDPLRERLGHPIVVSSGYRSPALNQAVGGASRNGKPTSQHCFGEAADITCPAIGQKQLFDYLRHSELPFDQLIDEFGQWVHVSFGIKDRREVLRARRIGDDVIYTNV